MRVCFIHQNMPAQFRHLIAALLQRGDEVLAVGERGAVERWGARHPRLSVFGYGLPPREQLAATPAHLRELDGQIARGQAVALGLSAPVDPDGGAVSITVYSTPYHGEVLLDGHAVHAGSLTAGELTRLQFQPAADAHGPDTFVYLVTDDEGSTVARSVSFSATAADHTTLLQPLGTLPGPSGAGLPTADLFVV